MHHGCAPATLNVMGSEREVIATERLYFVARTVTRLRRFGRRPRGSESAKFRATSCARLLVWSERRRWSFARVGDAHGGQFLYLSPRPATVRPRAVCGRKLGAVVGNNYVVPRPEGREQLMRPVCRRSAMACQ